MPANWNPWHGCRKYSAGCQNCYVYRIDARHGGDASLVRKTADFDLPLKRKRDGSYKIPGGQLVWTCFSSDFLLDIADEWRPEAWAMMRERSDLRFLFLTKRIDRLAEVLPDDWGQGYANVHICCTVENQAMADYRLPIFRELPIRGKSIACEPLLGPIDMSAQLGPWVSRLIAGGESGIEARLCDYQWILSLRQQCIDAGVSFFFKQTGAHFKKDGRVYNIPRRLQSAQARKAHINYNAKRPTPPADSPPALPDGLPAADR